MTLVFNPSFEQIASTGVYQVRRTDRVYTVENVDGTKISANLPNQSDADVLKVIAAVRSAQPTVPSEPQLSIF